MQALDFAGPPAALPPRRGPPDTPVSATPVRPWRALGWAALLELLLIAGMVVWVQAHPPADKPVPIALTLEMPAPAVEKLPRPPEPLPTPPQAVTTRAPAPRLVATVPAPAPAPATPTPAEPAPASVVEAPQAFTAPPPQPPAPAAPAADHHAEYAALVKGAVQSAVVYPPGAVALNFRGRARIEFRLRDSVPSQVRLLASSGLGMADRAALQSALLASYPAPPAALQGRDETYQVWVEFRQR